MNKLYYYLLSAVLLGGIGAAILECGGSVCGNGVLESGEQCDKGMQNGVAGSGCSAQCQSVGIPRASVQVSFSLFQTEAQGYLGSACSDLGIDHWTLHLDGPTTDDTSMPCLTKQKLYDNVTPGMYSATLTMFDANNNALTKPVKTATMSADLNGPMAMLYVDLHQTDFLKQDYTGILLFDPSWGASGTSCASASPAVTMETVTLTPMGSTTPVAGMTVDGLKLDGTPGACFVKSGSASAERVSMMLPWGHYNLSIGGKAGSYLAYCKTFDVFVPAGPAPNAYELVVDAANPDAGAGSCP
jgi:cysteine-rich repeat protein